jgi:hypothetical protein
MSSYGGYPQQQKRQYSGGGQQLQPVSYDDVSNLTATLVVHPMESPLWHTGQALTCDVDAVIQHELNAGTTNFDFNMDFTPASTAKQ